MRRRTAEQILLHASRLAHAHTYPESRDYDGPDIESIDGSLWHACLNLLEDFANSTCTRKDMLLQIQLARGDGRPTP